MIRLLLAVLLLVGRATAETPTAWHPASGLTPLIVVPLDPPPSARPTPHSVAELVVTGVVSHMGATEGPGYLAIPKGRGWIVRLCGPGGCITRVSNDAGPSLAMQRRIADLYVGDFVTICGVPASFGLCDATMTLIGRLKP